MPNGLIETNHEVNTQKAFEFNSQRILETAEEAAIKMFLSLLSAQRILARTYRLQGHQTVIVHRVLLMNGHLVTIHRLIR